MLRAFGFLFAIVYGMIGILGFFPFFTENDLLFGIFKVNTWSNVISIFFALFSLTICFVKASHLMILFQMLGILIGIWAILGFIYGDNALFGLIANNLAFSWLNVIMAVIALILGFGSKETSI